MLSLRKVLVPIDLTPAATRVLEQAQEFAAKFSASIDLLHVWTPPAMLAPEALVTGVGTAQQPFLEWVANNARQQLGLFESHAQSAGIDIAHSYCELGDPATSIIEHAASGGYDLLVMGTHGRTGGLSQLGNAGRRPGAGPKPGSRRPRDLRTLGVGAHWHTANWLPNSLICVRGTGAVDFCVAARPLPLAEALDAA
jgi:nucleotide-binding universal stress UspA family protein